MYPQSKVTITARGSDISVFRRLRKTAKSDCWRRHVCLLSFRMEQRGSPEQKLMKFDDVLTVCRENSSLIKIRQELCVVYMKTNLLEISDSYNLKMANKGKPKHVIVIY